MAICVPLAPHRDKPSAPYAACVESDQALRPVVPKLTAQKKLTAGAVRKECSSMASPLGKTVQFILRAA
jgi:hypothetical protein